MIALICFVLALLASPFKSKSWLEAENAVLRAHGVVRKSRWAGDRRYQGVIKAKPGKGRAFELLIALL